MLSTPHFCAYFPSRTWISKARYHGPFLCSVALGKMWFYFVDIGIVHHCLKYRSTNITEKSPITNISTWYHILKYFPFSDIYTTRQLIIWFAYSTDGTFIGIWDWAYFRPVYRNPGCHILYIGIRDWSVFLFENLVWKVL